MIRFWCFGLCGFGLWVAFSGVCDCRLVVVSGCAWRLLLGLVATVVSWDFWLWWVHAVFSGFRSDCGFGLWCFGVVVVSGHFGLSGFGVVVVSGWLGWCASG